MDPSGHDRMVAWSQDGRMVASMAMVHAAETADDVEALLAAAPAGAVAAVLPELGVVSSKRTRSCNDPESVYYMAIYQTSSCYDTRSLKNKYVRRVTAYFHMEGYALRPHQIF